jgi:hypothetical protein
MGKPSDWEKLSDQDKDDIAQDLMRGLRGIFIVSQALEVAIGVLRKEKYPAVSDIGDMEILRERIFNFPSSAQLAKDFQKMKEFAKTYPEAPPLPASLIVDGEEMVTTLESFVAKGQAAQEAVDKLLEPQIPSSYTPPPRRRSQPSLKTAPRSSKKGTSTGSKTEKSSTKSSGLGSGRHSSGRK